MLSEFKRIKHGDMPGDIPRQAKIRMREQTTKFALWTGQLINEKLIKSFRRYINEKGRTVQRRRDKDAIRDGLDNS